MLGSGLTGKASQVAASISQIKKDMAAIEKSMANISSKSKGLNFTGAGRVNNNTGLGTASPQTLGLGGFSTPPPQGGSGMPGGGGSSLGKGLAAVGSFAYNTLPSFSSAYDQRSALYGVTNRFATGASIDYTKLQQNMNNAAGGFATSITSQAAASSYLANRGITGGAGYNNLMSQGSGLMALNPGLSQEQAVGMGAANNNPVFVNRMMGMGIRTSYANGTQRNMGFVAADLRSRLNIRSNKDFDKARNNGRWDFQMQAMGATKDQADMYASIMQNQLTNPNKPLKVDASLAQSRTGDSRSPWLRNAQTTGTESNKVASYSESMLAGFDKAQQAAQEINGMISNLRDVLAPIAAMKGAQGGFGMTSVGQGIGTFAGGFGGSVLAQSASRLLGKSGGLGQGVGTTIGQAARGVGKGIAVRGGAGIAGAAGALGQGALAQWGDSHGMGGDTGIGQAGRVAASAGVGALAGTAILPGIGTAVGAVVGLGVGLLTNNIGSTPMGDGAGAGGSAGGTTGGSSLSDFAQKYVGTPYRDTGSKASPEAGWGCSQFTAWVYKKYGKIIPAYAPAQFKLGKSVARGDIRPGDLVFFYYKDSPYKHTPNHVGIAISKDRMVHAATPKKGTIVSGIDWGHFVGARRLLDGNAVNSNNNGKTLSTAGPTANKTNGQGATDAAGAVSALASNIQASVSSVGGLTASTYSVTNAMSMGGSGTGPAPVMGGSARSVSATATASAAGAGAPSTPTSAGDGKNYTPESWAAAFLAKVGIAQTKYNVKAITTWERYEGGNWHNRAKYNPLNTTQKMDGNDPSINSVGVKAYSNWDEGLQASANTLNNGRYGSIIKALRGGTDKDILNAIGSSPWGTKNMPHYSKGAWNLSNDETARVHKGEMIIPASLAEVVRDGVRKSYAGQGSGSGKTVTIQVYPANASYAEAQRLAKQVKKILEEDDMLESIGGF